MPKSEIEQKVSCCVCTYSLFGFDFRSQDRISLDQNLRSKICLFHFLLDQKFFNSSHWNLSFSQDWKIWSSDPQLILSLLKKLLDQWPGCHLTWRSQEQKFFLTFKYFWSSNQVTIFTLWSQEQKFFSLLKTFDYLTRVLFNTKVAWSKIAMANFISKNY